MIDTVLLLIAGGIYGMGVCLDEDQVMAIATLKPTIKTLDTRQGSTAAVQRIRGWRLHKTRERIALRDDYTCQKCGISTVDGVVDHRVPLFQGGTESDENRQWLCLLCHDEKSEQEEKERGRGGSNL